MSVHKKLVRALTRKYRRPPPGWKSWEAYRQYILDRVNGEKD